MTTLADALRYARAHGLHLVETVATASPPVCVFYTQADLAAVHQEERRKENEKRNAARVKELVMAKMKVRASQRARRGAALHCTALHYTALHCTALHCTALHCTALRCDAVRCIEACRG